MTKVEFDLDPSVYAGKQVVHFEKVYDGNLLWGEHEDITDQSQTIDISLKLEIEIVKKDTKKKDVKLKGAEFTVFYSGGTPVLDKNGQVIKGVTDENGKLVLETMFSFKQGMYVQETKAPKGYQISKEKFPLKKTDKGKLGVDKIVLEVFNQAIIIPPTGDGNKLILFGGLTLLALVGATSVLIIKKKKN